MAIITKPDVNLVKLKQMYIQFNTVKRNLLDISRKYREEKRKVAQLQYELDSLKREKRILETKLQESEDYRGSNR